MTCIAYNNDMIIIHILECFVVLVVLVLVVLVVVLVSVGAVCELLVLDGVTVFVIVVEETDEAGTKGFTIII